MPLIEDITERRVQFQKTSERVGARQDSLAVDNDWSVSTSGLEGIEHLPEEYLNEGLARRVNRVIADEIKAGKSEWPEWTQFSRNHFRSNETGITNVAYYAVHVEERENPRTHPPQPARSYVLKRWVDVAEEDIAEQRGQTHRRG